VISLLIGCDLIIQIDVPFFRKVDLSKIKFPAMSNLNQQGVIAMKKSKFSEEQIAYALRQSEAGTKVEEICHQLPTINLQFPMIFSETPLRGAYIIEIAKKEDKRGCFGRSWCVNEMMAHGLNTRICQINTSKSLKRGTLRGMHYQIHPYQEVKLMRCTYGTIYDVIIDLRPESDTYMKWFGIELSNDNYKMLYVPEDFAHGFITLENDCEVTYSVSQSYTPAAEAGIRWNDPAFNIEWPNEALVVSEKDCNYPDYNK
jgi:dTDP-4-dehydrorhamnose 3,5-epimerase